MAPLAANSSGSRNWESRLRFELGITVEEEEEFEVLTGLAELEVTEGEAGQEEVDTCLGGRGTLNRPSSLERPVGVLGVESVLARLAYRGWCEASEAMLT